MKRKPRVWTIPALLGVNWLVLCPGDDRPIVRHDWPSALREVESWYAAVAIHRWLATIGYHRHR